MPHQSRWHHPLCIAPRKLKPWLTERGSLTARLVAHFPCFSVRVLRQNARTVHRDELRTLHVQRQQKAITRDVLLMSGETPLVYAHSVATRAATRRGFRRLRGIGNRSLGSMLFADPTIRRSPLAWRRVDQRHPLWQQARAAVGPLPRGLWARRSLFASGSDLLLVTEVFLPPAFDVPFGAVNTR
ncbi:chorismate--pyruvate lyase [Silvimonas terrae]|uniref:Probable chorismate pyruvate-lyase n=1 Tax=Silvimonas terrae TaxID=300266 RepID=A0A840RL78_9NEIS|nr:chorismate lyase [Silvimonas terrae]MBB5192962.1 chorismate--pyruvate lyase [Silvimonas terrae]